MTSDSREKIGISITVSCQPMNKPTLRVSVYKESSITTVPHIRIQNKQTDNKYDEKLTILSPPPFKIPPTRPHSVLPEALPDPPRRPSGSASPCNDYQLCGSSSPHLISSAAAPFRAWDMRGYCGDSGNRSPVAGRICRALTGRRGGKKRSQGGVYVPRAGPKEKEKEKKTLGVFSTLSG